MRQAVKDPQFPPEALCCVPVEVLDVALDFDGNRLVRLAVQSTMDMREPALADRRFLDLGGPATPIAASRPGPR